MFDVGFWEFALIGVVTLVIVGPERLPGLARTAGAYLGKARRMMNEVKADVKRELKENEIADVSQIKKDFTDATQGIRDAAKDVGDKIGATDLQESLKDTAAQASSLVDDVKSGVEDISSEPEILAEAPTAQKKATKKKSSKKTAAKKKATKKTAEKKKVSKKKTAKKTTKKTAAKKTTTKKAAVKKTAAKKSSEEGEAQS